MKKNIIIYFLIMLTSISYAQIDFIGRKINQNQPKALSSKNFKSGDTIPKMDFKFDSIRPLNELKTGNGESFPWLSTDGNRIYYSEGENTPKIYIAEKKTGEYKFSNPHLLKNITNDSFPDNYSAWLTNDELNIYFIEFSDTISSFYLCHAKRESINQNFSTPVKVKLNGIGGFIYSMGGPSITQDSNQLYMHIECSGISKPINSICIFNKTAENEYTLTDSLHIPKNYTSGIGTLTSDGLNYYFNMGINNYTSFYVFKRDSVKEQFKKLYNINNTSINDINFDSRVTPYYSTSNNIFAFSKGDSGNVNSSWVIYFAYNFQEYDNIKEINKTTNYINIFPNPAQNYVELLSFQSQHSFEYYLTDLTGKSIKSGIFINYKILDMSKVNKGVYFLSIYDKNENLKTCYKIIKL